MSGRPSASVIISNYNYGRFLGQAIESALGQTYPETEVIVVDDGSTDNSREVLAHYAVRVRVLLKENGGQAAAFNEGFRASQGDVIVLLDADDLLLPTAVEQAVGLFSGGGTAKAHWPLWVMDERGRRTGEVCPDWGPLAEGDLREAVLRRGADGYVWPPTSGNCWSRAFLDQVMPLPEAGNPLWPDFYLATLAPLYGLVHRLPEPQGLYRIHGTNWTSGSIETRLEWLRQQQDRCEEALSRHCRALGLHPDIEGYRRHSWYEWLRQIHVAARDLAGFVSPQVPYILVDEATWETRDLALPGRPIPFPERHGQYGGRPADDETAVREFERLRRAGAAYMVFGWPAFWWLEHYKGLTRRLRSEFRCVLENDRVIVFDLRGGRPDLPHDEGGCRELQQLRAEDRSAGRHGEGSKAMRNCLILGSGRSGTSLLAGLLAQAGYYMGEQLLAATEANPKGFFEDDEVNAINEALLAPVTPARSRPAYGWRWLAAVPLGTRIPCPADLAGRIAAQTARSPFCLKDPRFSYTLPAWRPFLPDTVFLCVFREPARTAQSILKECGSADYLEGLPMDFGGALEVWSLMYRHILEMHRHAGHWLFFHYDQLFEDGSLANLEAVLGAPVNRRFPDARLRRSAAEGEVGGAALEVYEQLCELASYRGPLSGEEGPHG
jgi:hypothetical protein